jgi:tetratricopeptide (TPR) repeat protein
MKSHFTNRSAPGIHISPGARLAAVLVFILGTLGCAFAQSNAPAPTFPPAPDVLAAADTMISAPATNAPVTNAPAPAPAPAAPVAKAPPAPPANLTPAPAPPANVAAQPAAPQPATVQPAATQAPSNPPPAPPAANVAAQQQADTAAPPPANPPASMPATDQTAPSSNAPAAPLSADASAMPAAEAPAAPPTNADSSPLSENPPSSQPSGDAPAPEAGQLPTPGIVGSNPVTSTDKTKSFQSRLDLARKQRADKDPLEAGDTLKLILDAQNAPADVKRNALFEFALITQDEGRFIRAEQIFAQYLHLYPDDPTAPEVLLRQGLIYRQMGVSSMAVSKFYAVMSTALRLKLDNMDYYKKLVLQAQIEIADTYYLEGHFAESADFFGRLLKNPSPDLDQEQIQYKLIRSLSSLTNSSETVAHAEVFLNIYTNSMDVPEVRFLLADSLKHLGRNQESLKQVLLLLQTERDNVDRDPELWAYWQRRAGNEIAGQLYKEGDYLDALAIDLNLADLDKSPAWQLPVWYQTGLIYEQLEQWQKARDIYQRIIDTRGALADADASPSLISLSDMAKWRKDYIAWQEKAKIANLTYERSGANSIPPAASVGTP